eukprot:COSAG05_NODE_509_length_9130_cov_3.978740_3_plen_95_part_00
MGQWDNHFLPQVTDPIQSDPLNTNDVLGSLPTSGYMFYLPNVRYHDGVCFRDDPEKGSLIVTKNCFRFNSVEGQQAVQRQLRILERFQQADQAA